MESIFHVSMKMVWIYMIWWDYQWIPEVVFYDCHLLKHNMVPTFSVFLISLWTTVFFPIIEHIGALTLYFHNTHLVIPSWLRRLYAFEKVVNRFPLPWAQWPGFGHTFWGYTTPITEGPLISLWCNVWFDWSSSTTWGLEISFPW